MRRRLAALTTLSLLLAAACNELFDIETPSLVSDPNDGSTDGMAPGLGADGAVDGSTTGPGTDAAGIDVFVPPRVLVTYNATGTELVAINLQTLVVDGRYQAPGFIGTSWSDQAPYLLEQEADLVLRMDSVKPWTSVSKWSVKGGDRIDGGLSFTDPDALVMVSPKKAYVLRYTRNEIEVIDPSVVATGTPATPTTSLSLAQFLDPNDSDGTVEATAATFDALNHRLYVLLGNIDKNKVSADGFTLLCTGASSLLVAIDTNNDTFVQLGSQTSVPLKGYNPPLGQRMIFRPDDSLLVMNAGCNAKDGGAQQQRQIDQVSIGQYQVVKLLDLNTQGFPSSFALITRTTAAISFFGGPTYSWPTAANQLGPAIPGAPDVFSADGQGNLVGTRSVPIDGGGSATQVVRVSLDGGVQVLGTKLETIGPPAFVANVEVWPIPTIQ